MIGKVSWSLMTALSVLVATYALAMVLVPATRVDFVGEMFVDHMIAAPAHLAGGGIALIAGAFQFSQRLRRNHLVWHRWMGRIYLLSVAVGGTAAFNMALTTPGGAAGKFGFSMLAVSWLITTSFAWLRILQGDVQRHRIWMVRSYALTFAAVMLRIYLPLSLGNGVSFEAAYPVIAWMCWVPNLLVAEWLILPAISRRPARDRAGS